MAASWLLAPLLLARALATPDVTFHVPVGGASNNVAQKRSTNVGKVCLDIISGSGRAVAAIRKDRQPYTLNPILRRGMFREGRSSGCVEPFRGYGELPSGSGAARETWRHLPARPFSGVCAFREKDQATSPETPRKLREESSLAEV